MFIHTAFPAALLLSLTVISAASAAPPEAPRPLQHEAVTVPMSLAEMGAENGGQAVKVESLSTQELTAVSSGNSVVAGTLTSGAVTFSPQALQGFSGVGNFVINTGANNALQGAVNINIVTVPQS